jgi:hypothetical protein
MRGWNYIAAFGEYTKIYGNGRMRRLIGNDGKIIVEYSVDN